MNVQGSKYLLMGHWLLMYDMSLGWTRLAVESSAAFWTSRRRTSDLIGLGSQHMVSASSSILNIGAASRRTFNSSERLAEGVFSYLPSCVLSWIIFHVNQCLQGLIPLMKSLPAVFASPTRFAPIHHDEYYSRRAGNKSLVWPGLG